MQKPDDVVRLARLSVTRLRLELEKLDRVDGRRLDRQLLEHRIEDGLTGALRLSAYPVIVGFRGLPAQWAGASKDRHGVGPTASDRAAEVVRCGQVLDIECHRTALRHQIDEVTGAFDLSVRQNRERGAECARFAGLGIGHLGADDDQYEQKSERIPSPQLSARAVINRIGIPCSSATRLEAVLKKMSTALLRWRDNMFPKLNLHACTAVRDKSWVRGDWDEQY